MYFNGILTVHFFEVAISRSTYYRNIITQTTSGQGGLFHDDVSRYSLIFSRRLSAILIRWILMRLMFCSVSMHWGPNCTSNRCKLKDTIYRSLLWYMTCILYVFTDDDGDLLLYVDCICRVKGFIGDTSICSTLFISHCYELYVYGY